ncbi:MAG: type restriction enzyme subunit [Carnobacterium sp.]|uniref:restriction endonuclease subunit S n=1 Tax=Carnobacterium sp. TaxID=48221 RepID=UPI002648BF52|nr:restriction endonuclease subunit S [Carnobacterium sp.]MDN5371740.1 type restriction enzyme subunit [Carnobacterium sp.]
MNIYSEHFETVLSTKQSIRSLRTKVLELAVRGRLVKQDPNEETASELVKKILSEKNSRSNKKIKDYTYEQEVPNGWTVIKMGEIAAYKKGPFGSSITKSMFVTKSKDTYKIYEQKNAIQKDASLGNYYITENKYETLKSNNVIPGDVIVSCAGTVGETFVLPPDSEPGIINQALMRVRLTECVLTDYYLMYFDSILEEQIKGNSKGSAIKNIPPLKILKDIDFFLPPIEEQKRIVQRVKSINSEIDVLENYLKRKERLQEAIPKAVVSAISNCHNEEELKAEMALVIEYFFDVFQTPESLQELRDVIVHLGIQGKLLPQNSNDEPAIQLLESIKKEKENLIKYKKIKKEKSLREIESDDIPFEIPNNWEWVKLGDISNKIHYGYTAPSKSKGDAKLLRITDIQKGKVNWENVPMCDIALEKVEQYLLGEEDIVIARTGGTVGKSFIIRNIQGESVFASYLIRVVLTDKRISEYIYNYLYSPLYWNEIQEQSKGTGQPNVNAQNLKNLMIPLPPLKEQDRIVSKINSLTNLIDQLEVEMRKKVLLVENMATV